MKKYVNNSFINKSPLEYKNGTEAVTSLPVTLYTDGQPVSSYTLKGNTTTSGTPSPSNPITINGVGEKTANLLEYYIDALIYSDGSIVTSQSYQVYCAPVIAGETYTLGNTIDVYGFYSSQPVLNSVANDGTRHFRSQTQDGVITIPSGTTWIGCRVVTGANAMFNLGSTPIPYEPYGKYKISISSNQQALTPVYLTEQLMKIGDTVDSLASSGTVTRNIKKVVFTGQEATSSLDPSSNIFAIRGIFNSQPEILQVGGLCTHYKYNNAISSLSANMQDGDFVLNKIVNDYSFTIRDAAMSSAEDFKTFLQQQYAAGTPVTVYYVLATAATESVTAPTIPTTGGTATIDVDTTVKPSEFDLTYHGWHSHEPLKRENGSWS